MTSLTFDTLEYSKTLQEAGVPQKQAEAIATAQNRAVQEVINAQQFATKSDIFAVKSDIQEVRAELKAEIQEVRTELKAEIQEVRTELKTDIQEVRTELKADIQALDNKISDTKHEIMKWITNLVIALFVAQSALFVGIMAFMK